MSDSRWRVTGAVKAPAAAAKLMYGWDEYSLPM